MNPTLIINEELQSLLPPLTPEEYAGLEASLLKDGCISPLVVWDDTLVDGHQRYEICRKHGLLFSVRNMRFSSLDDAKLWSGMHQQHRRNLTAYHRTELVLKLKDSIAAKAKERQLNGASLARQGLKLPGPPISTRGELAKMAATSPNTLDKVEFLVQHADDSTKDRLRRGEKGTSIHGEYMRLRADRTPEPMPKSSQSEPETPLCLTSLKVAQWMVRRFSPEWVRETLLRVLHEYRTAHGQDEANAIHHYLCQAYTQANAALPDGHGSRPTV